MGVGAKKAAATRADPCRFLLLNDEGPAVLAEDHRGQPLPRHRRRYGIGLLDRVRVDHPDFPRYGFNTLRDTSSNMIREIGGEEVTSMHLTHEHQSKDRNLRTTRIHPWNGRLFRSQRKLERKLQAVFDAAPDNPFAPQMRIYLPRKVIKQIRKMKDEGHSISEIVRATKVARTTVYRHLGQVHPTAQASLKTGEKNSN